MSSITASYGNPQAPSTTKTANLLIDTETTRLNEQAFEAYNEALKRGLEANFAGGYAQMPHAVRNDPTLSAKAKIIYEQLLSYMWFKSDKCFPSQETLARETGYSRRTVIRAIKELYERCYIEVRRLGQGWTNYYFINPLSFVQSFRRTEREPVAKTRLLVDDPARLQTLETTPHPIISIQECQDGTSRSDKAAQPKVSDWHTKNTKLSNTQMKDVSSNDSTAALKGTVLPIAATTIRNTQDSPIPNEDTIPTHPTPTTVPTSNPNILPNREEEAGRGERAKAVKDVVVAQKQPSAQAAAIAATTGIPAAHLAELGISQEQQKRSIPDFVKNIMDDYTRELGDSPRSAKSNVTRAAKLYYFGVDCLKDAQEDPEGWFIGLLYQAKDAAYLGPNIHHRSAGNRINRLPYFFTCLENLFRFNPDELAYIRSDAPLLVQP